MKAWLLLGLFQVADGGGCGGQPGEPRVYGLSFRTSGSLTTEHASTDRPPAVMSDRSHGPGLQASFALSEHEVKLAQLWIADVMPGQPGQGYPARLAFTVGARRFETASCVATIREQQLQHPTGGATPTGQSYLVVGAMECPEPLAPTEGPPDRIRVESLAFAMPVAWDNAFVRGVPPSP